MSVSSSLSKTIWNAVSNHGINIGLTGYFGIDAYQEARREGSSFLGGAAAAAESMILPMVMPGGIPGYLAFELATSAPSLAIDFYKAQRDYRRKLGVEQRHKAFQSASFQDTQMTYTMRQAAMAIAQRSRYNTQAAMLGQEAQYMLK